MVYETTLLGLAAVRRFFRVPGNWIWIPAFPLIQLLVFSQLFKDIVQLPGFGDTSYLAYLAPGQIAFTVFFATTWAGTNLLMHYHSGFLDKLRVAPIARSSILYGELVPLFLECAVMAGIILAVSFLLGAPIATGVPGAVAILLLGSAFGVAWSGTSFIPALLTKNDQASGTFGLLFMPIAFMSTAFVPPALMPEWLQAVNRVNPISYVIEAMRALMISGFDWVAIGKAALAIAAIGTVLQAITFWAFRRLANA